MTEQDLKSLAWAFYEKHGGEDALIDFHRYGEEEIRHIFNLGLEVEFAKYLVEFGANKDAGCAYRETPLFRCDSAALAEYYIGLGISVNRMDEAGRTALFLCENTEVCECLIRHGASVYEEDECARTPLFYCRSAEICECLLKYGAEVDHVNDEGRSALMGTSDIDIL